MMTTHKKLVRRQRERSTLLSQVIALAKNDPHICAAWLFGSGYRADADAFSDIDLWTVVDDARIDEIVSARHAYVTQIGQPLLMLDVLGNGPVGGGYLMLQYPGQHGPLQVDWYWQPRSHAAIPDDARVLFDRAGLSRLFGSQSTGFSYTTNRLRPPAPVTEPGIAQQLLHELTFFWCMSLIAAKDIARRDAEGAGWMLQYAAQKLDKARALASPESQERFADAMLDPSTISVNDAMRQLRGLHNAAVALIPILMARGGALPSQLVPNIEQFFELTEATGQLDRPGNLVRRP